MKKMIVAVAGIAAFLSIPLVAQGPAPSGETLYNRDCAQCHNGGMDRAPRRQDFTVMSANRILSTMENGAMVTMALRMNAADRKAVAEYLSGKTLGALATSEQPPVPEAMCNGAAASAPFTIAGPSWNGWGVNLNNSRFMDASGAQLTASTVPKLKVKWAFGFPGDLQTYSQPVVVGGRVFVGSAGGRFYSLSATTGCIHWYYDVGVGTRSASTVANIGTAAAPRYAVFFGDSTGGVHAVDATNGKPIWKVKADNFPVARITGAVAFYNGTLYVPVASGEEAAAGGSPLYECCRFRGSIVALKAATGEQIWKTYLVDEPKPTKKNAKGAQLWGPSGSPVWTAPTIDPKNNAVYVTTGDNYSEPTTGTSDAVISLDLTAGKIQWIHQVTANDAYTSACRLVDRTNCPDVDGPDLDFASAAILVNLGNGKRALVVGQKSGVVHGFDPDNKGAVLWSTRIGKGGTGGGVQWGSAVDSDKMYVALSDIGRIQLAYSQATDADPNTGGGMFALSLKNGEKIWYTPPAKCGTRPRCSPAQSAAVTAIPGIAFSGSLDGHLRAYAAKDGKVIWDFDTVQEFPTINRVPGKGGSMDGPGPSVVGGMLFVNSGYPTAGGIPGNLLLAFSVDGK